MSGEMTDSFCPSCGTEVDADARFCPTCGTTLAEPAGMPVIPDAPAWPAPAEATEPAAVDEQTEAGLTDDDPAPDLAGSGSVPPSPASDEVPPAAGPPAEAAPEPAPAPEPVTNEPSPGSARGSDMPFTVPATIGGWMIGGGAGLGALALILRLNDMLSLFLFLALLGVAATIFLADRLPKIANQRLLVLVVVMVGLGVALDRAAFTVRGLETILLISMLTAAGGVLLVELDRDRPVPPPNAPRA
jgi:hypothetical protein